MNLHRTPLPVEQAIEKVLSYRKTGQTETVSLANAEERVLAEDILARHPVPPFDKSPYDGFALRSEDTRGLNRSNPGEFRVVETIGAGYRATNELKQGEAVRIMTGAEIPSGADCVAMFEICQTYEKEGNSYIQLKRELTPHQNVITKGSETSEGELLIKRGTRIHPGIIALLATFGYSMVDVYTKPKVGIFATGTELLDVEEELVPGKIRNSNAYMIASQVRRAGGIPVYFGKLEDDFQIGYEAVSRSLHEVDLLITSGGVSVGDFDLMPDIYDKLGAQVLFNKVAMRPGSVTTVAEHEGKLLFGLSGNPSACFVGFELFTFPIIQAHEGKDQIHHQQFEAILGQDFKKANPFTRFVRGLVHFEDGKIVVEPVGLDKSAVVTSLAHANVLIKLRGGTRGYQKGDRVSAIMVGDLMGQARYE